MAKLVEILVANIQQETIKMHVADTSLTTRSRNKSGKREWMGSWKTAARQ